MIITSPTHTDFEMESNVCSPEPIPPTAELVGNSWVLLLLTCRNKFVALNPN